MKLALRNTAGTTEILTAVLLSFFQRMRNHLGLCILLSALPVALPIAVLASSNPASYILIRDLGGDDRSSPFLVITADKEIATSFQAGPFKDPAGWPKDLVTLSVSRRVHLLDDKAFDKIDAFVEKQSRDFSRRKPEPGIRASDSIEMSRRSRIHELSGFDFMVPRKEARSFLERLLGFLEEQEISMKLEDDVRDLLNRAE